jgi:hypothetical protein
MRSCCDIVGLSERFVCTCDKIGKLADIHNRKQFKGGHLLMVCDIHYDSKDLDATKVDADFYGKDFADELADIASLIDGILNIVVIKHCMPGDWEETSTTFKDVLISLMSNREGTDIESFAKIFGLNE